MWRVVKEALGDGILEALQILMDDALLFEKHDQVLLYEVHTREGPKTTVLAATAVERNIVEGFGLHQPYLQRIDASGISGLGIGWAFRGAACVF
jgi:hypothetical protein